MGDVVNLNHFRKRKERLDGERRAAERRAKTGRKKTDRERARSESERRRNDLDGKRIDSSTPGDDIA